jgi:integrase
VDLDRAQLMLRDTKNGERRSIPLASHPLNRLQARRERLPQSEWVFPNRRSTRRVDVAKAWKLAVVRAGLVDFRFHDLRHTTASYLAMQGCTSLQIAEILGHRTLQMVKRYSHLSVDHSRSSLETLNGVLFENARTPA